METGAGKVAHGSQKAALAGRTLDEILLAMPGTDNALLTLEFSGAELDPSDAQQVAATAAVELEASRRDPYRQLSRVFHLVGRKGPN